jgi:hypothetical protein
LQARCSRDRGKRIFVELVEEGGVGAIERAFEQAGAGKRAELRVAIDNRISGFDYPQNLSDRDRFG